jgi:hypothetical protein
MAYHASDIRHIVTSRHIPFEDGTDIPRAMRILQNRCWLLGWASYWVSKSGSLLKYSLLDVVAGGPEREVFEAPPNVKPPLVQDLEARKAIVVNRSGRLTKISDFLDLTADEQCRINELETKLREQLKPTLDEAKVLYVEEKSAELKTKGIDLEVARAAVERMLTDDVLVSGMTVEFVDKNLDRRCR